MMKYVIQPAQEKKNVAKVAKVLCIPLPINRRTAAAKSPYLCDVVLKLSSLDTGWVGHQKECWQCPT